MLLNQFICISFGLNINHLNIYSLQVKKKEIFVMISNDFSNALRFLMYFHSCVVVFIVDCTATTSLFAGQVGEREREIKKSGTFMKHEISDSK